MSDTKGARRRAPQPDPDRTTPAEWLEGFTTSDMTEWERLPDIGLYMDQVLTLVDRQLAFYRRGEDDRLVTSAMVNNYIKDGLLPRAESKKYTPAHLALLLVTVVLKQVMSIPDIRRIVSTSQTPEAAQKLYSRFLDLQRDGMRETAGLIQQARLSDAAGMDPEQYNEKLRMLSLELVVEARTRVLAAQKVLDMLDLNGADVPSANPPEKP